ncbi:C45 family peptidase [Alteribacillus sp. YIM 98480]|uniref:C45 family autoproteolytic acyltransferase/hydolase n=1 Tax=Alteribacillus sp. YIM 98480 TaxID=2606599 RepID=UPI001E53EC4F|nr:C45 family peptidase [Alteribacillus sp. YIM 98480]
MMPKEQNLNIEPEGKRIQKTFPYFKLQGTPREIGRQYGEKCKDLIHQHLHYSISRLKERVEINSKIIKEKVLSYQEYVLQYAPFFDEEIRGVAEGAGITLDEAYLLQLRAEIYEDLDASLECTTFAYKEEASCDQIPLIGQNADLPDFYSDIGVILEIIPNEGPSILMLTPAGQVSYIGINDQGLGVFANFLTCDEWRIGFPRYLTSRLALTQRTVNDASSLLSSVYRASSRNLIMLDAENNILDLETTATALLPLHANNGILAHANHYLKDELLSEERLPGIFFKNSQVRQERINELLEEHNGALDMKKVMEVFRDRETYPHCLSRIRSDIKNSDVITFASVIASPSTGEIWVAAGPPHLYEYKRYTFSS